MTSATDGSNIIVPDELVMSKILLIRDKKVMMDRDLADFMFRLTAEEKDQVVAKCDHLVTMKYSPVLPYVF